MTSSTPDDFETIHESHRSGADRHALDASIASLGVVWHPDPSMIGAIAPLQFDSSVCALVSRLTPRFARRADAASDALNDRHLSRKPVMIERVSDTDFAVTPPDSKMGVWVNGERLAARRIFSLDVLGRDIIINLGNCVVLSLFYSAPIQLAHVRDDYGLTGVSREIVLVRGAIARVADTPLAVLIRGETGAGKELIASAIHLAGKRARKPKIAVNMAAVSGSLAAAELFGVKRGAFTGAVQDRKGLFEQADGGTLFLDEIGDTPRDVQPMLLRALEEGAVRRVGDDRMRMVDVRVLAATDRSLELGADEPSFNQPLLRRLETFTIAAPPLRMRRVDIGLLAQSFGAASARLGDAGPFNAATVTRLALYAWPGNVRELRNIVQQASLGGPVDIPATAPPTTSGTSGPTASVAAPPAAPPPPVKPAPKPEYRAASTVSDDELIGALDAAGWVIKDAARAMSISRTALYALMSECVLIRNIDDITDEELRRAATKTPSDLGALAARLRVGREALRRRLKGLSPQAGRNNTEDD